MLTAGRIVLWTALAVWLGALVLLSFVVAPTVFQVLPRPEAATLMRALFPRYYALGAGAGVLAAGAAFVLWRATRAGAWAAVTLMLALMLGATLYARQVVLPETEALRPALVAPAGADPAARARFDRLHARAVWLNGGVLLLGVASVGVAAASLRLGRD